MSAGEPFTWRRRGVTVNRLAGRDFDGIVLTNVGDSDASVNVEVVTGPFYPQVSTIIASAVFVVGLFLLYMIKRWFVSKNICNRAGFSQDEHGPTVIHLVDDCRRARANVVYFHSLLHI